MSFRAQRGISDFMSGLALARDPSGCALRMITEKMGIFSKTKEEVKKKPAAKKEAPIKAAKEAPSKPAKFSNKVVKKEFTEAYHLIKKPLVTEKSVNLSSLQNQYAFAVAPDATKNEVKKVIQELYGVRVKRVNIFNTQGKKRRVGRHEGFKPGFKKALVFLDKEDKIEVISR